MSAGRLYLLDVEGTVAPLTLTTEMLFPYARKHFKEFLSENVEDPGVREDLIQLAEENRAEIDPSSPRIMGAPGPSHLGTRESASADVATEEALSYLLWLMDRDRKSTALKSLQGKIWKAGFESGELKGTVFLDVPPAFSRWAANGKVAIYSSGSVDAQKLFFRHSSAGDLTPLIAGYFDTRTGPKFEAASYQAIAAEMKVNPGEALFLSDAVRELDAAREAGFETRLTVRPGNPPVDDARGHAMISTFDEMG
ncbi:MAG TPA: acireductone synthase [Terracidiphilus sp.]|nr:acireductone synthase [Terracidiphilus sp.]